MESIICKKPDHSIAKILSQFFPSFQEIFGKEKNNLIRDRVSECVQNIMLCGSQSLGFATYQCPGCKKIHTQSFTCKRPICSSCSKPRCDKRVNGINQRLPTNIKYLHLTFTLPSELRVFWLKYRKYGTLNILFQQVHSIIINFFAQRFGCKPGVFSIIHTFGSAINWNPHIHCILTLGGITEINGIQSRLDIQGQHISYTHFKKTWRACIIRECRNCLSLNAPEDYSERNIVFQKLFHKERYVTVSDPITNVVYIMNYITRYMYRPPVSLSNIIDITNTGDIHTSTITIKYFHKKPKEQRIITYSMLEFMGILARQIPDKYFKTVRYGGIFAPQCRKKYLTILSSCTRYLHSQKIPQRPKTFSQRIQSAFGHNPLHCTECNLKLHLISLTFFCKKTQSFITKYFDSS